MGEDQKLGLAAGAVSGAILQLLIWVFLVESLTVVNTAAILGGIVGFMGAVAALATKRPNDIAIAGTGPGCLTGCFVAPIVVFIAFVIGTAFSGEYEPDKMLSMLFNILICAVIVSLSGGAGGFAAIYASRK